MKLSILVAAAVLLVALTFSGAARATAQGDPPAGLSIAVPGGADLGSVPTGSLLISAPLAPVTVTDLRVGSDGWVVTVSATAFTTGGAALDETIPAAAVRYWSGPATGTTGGGTSQAGQPTVGSAVSIAGAIAFSHTGAGENMATWNPTIIVDLPAGVLAGVYSGAITHSVA